ncbi:MAG: NADH:flavin oxidoreductase, partial [Oscillospiraceae bacterium]|nr:NADH:flavin oxidoreductase [Oscillospiraceae bacterium]
SEAAIHLAQEGKTVHLVEMRSELAPDANVRHRPLMLGVMDDLSDKLHIHLDTMALRVEADGVVCEDPNGAEVKIPGASVICALGQRSNTKTVEALQDTAPYVRVIGDASRVSNITNATYWGHWAALDI